MLVLQKDEAEQKKKGYVIFLQGQVKRYMNVDECALFLDGTVEKQASRPSSTPSTAGIAKIGEAKSKSTKKISVQFGVAGNEALPFHIIVPSSAKERNQKLDARMFPSFKEVEKKYGLSQVYHHDCYFLCNKSGYVYNHMYYLLLTTFSFSKSKLLITFILCPFYIHTYIVEQQKKHGQPTYWNISANSILMHAKWMDIELLSSVIVALVDHVLNV